MTVENEHAVGLRELRHSTSEVLARVRRGEVIDVTEYGRPIARIVPIQNPEPSPVVQALVRSRRLRLAARPGYRPVLPSGSQNNRLNEALKELRDEESW